MTAGIRLQRYLSSAGVASRRASEDLIRAGRVSLNGEVVTEMGVRVRPGKDRVSVDGRPVHAVPPVWIAVHKPRAVVSTRSDPQGRRTVYDLLPPDYHGLFHVGRLDYDSEGLLLLTNEGEAANRLLHPRFEVEREYEAEVEGVPRRAALGRLMRGVELEDGPARADEARVVDRQKDESARVRLTLREGRNREVRRLLEAVGHPVRRLKRVRYGPIELGDLAPGDWRRLTRAEQAAIRRGGRRS
jgi:23S rRNA pseudouridine2605 synthase